jgi:ribosomal protein L11 methyltransferase
VIRLAVRVERARADVVLAELLELAPGGVEEVELDGGAIEYAVYGAPGELPALPDLDALAGGAAVQISTSEIADDWQERWRDFHRPVLVEHDGGARALLVRPPWELCEDVPAETVELVIDPGQAFGTGGHATTRLCLGLLLELHAREGPEAAVLDVGSGSGVLAIAAAKLGFAPLLALDNEPESVLAARQNATANGVELLSRRFELRSEPLPWLGTEAGEAHEPRRHVIVLANLLRPLLLVLAESLQRPPSHLIAGGMLSGELDEIAAAFHQRHGLLERARRSEGEWGALWLSA